MGLEPHLLSALRAGGPLFWGVSGGVLHSYSSQHQPAGPSPWGAGRRLQSQAQGGISNTPGPVPVVSGVAECPAPR